MDSFKSKEVVGCAAWLHGDQLLMCRIGSPESRYSGWVEITMRSPVTRIRRLVRLSNRISLKRPNFPSSLWDASSASSEVPKSPLREKKLDKIQTLERLEKRRFCEITYNAEESLKRFSEMENMNGILLNQPRHTGSLKIIIEKHKGEHGEMRRSLSAENLTIRASSESLLAECKSEQDPCDDPSSIQSFLRFSLNITERGGDLNLEEVQRKFLELCYPGSHGGTIKELRRLQWSQQLERAISIFDRISFLQTHKVRNTFQYFT